MDGREREGEREREAERQRGREAERQRDREGEMREVYEGRKGGRDVMAIMEWVHTAWNGCIVGNLSEAR